MRLVYTGQLILDEEIYMTLARLVCSQQENAFWWYSHSAGGYRVELECTNKQNTNTLKLIDIP